MALRKFLSAARDGAVLPIPHLNGYKIANPTVLARIPEPELRSLIPKGWTGPKEVDRLPAEGSFRSHQVPLANLASNPEHVAQLESWMRSYRPEELFNEAGALREELADLAPRGERRMGANPHANGGTLLRDLELPDFRGYAAEVPEPARTSSEPTRVLGGFLRDVMRLNAEHANSGCSGQMRQRRTASAQCSRPPTAPGRRGRCQPTITSQPTAA